MTGSSWSVAALCVLFAGCGGGCGGVVDPGSDDPRSERAGGDEPASAGARVIAEPGSPPVLRVVGEPSPHERGVAIRVENRGGDAAVLAGELGLQRRAGDRWEDLEGVTLGLRFSCDDPLPECVTLAPGGTYLPPPWSARIGAAQCGCEGCAAAPAGDYRFVVRSCGGAHTVEGESFTIAAD